MVDWFLVSGSKINIRLTVANKSVPLTPDQAVWLELLRTPLCSWEMYSTFKVPFFTQGYEWGIAVVLLESQ